MDTTLSMSLEYKMKDTHRSTSGLPSLQLLFCSTPARLRQLKNCSSSLQSSKRVWGTHRSGSSPSLQLSVARVYTAVDAFNLTLGLSARKTNDDPGLDWANFSLTFLWHTSLTILAGYLAWGREVAFGAGSQVFLTGTTYVKRIYPSGYFVVFRVSSRSHYLNKNYRLLRVFGRSRL